MSFVRDTNAAYLECLKLNIFFFIGPLDFKWNALLVLYCELFKLFCSLIFEVKISLATFDIGVVVQNGGCLHQQFLLIQANA